MISLLASILLTGSVLSMSSDSLTVTRDSLLTHKETQTQMGDSMPTATLREVTIRPDSMLPVQRIVEQIIKKEREEQIHVPSLGEYLQKRFPRLNDIITHPTAFRQRRREARTRRCLKNLEDYDKLKTFDDLLREAYERQMLEDSLNSKP